MRQILLVLAVVMSLGRTMAQAAPLKISDFSKAIMLQQNQTELELVLPANPSTGYRWWFVPAQSSQWVEAKKVIYIAEKTDRVGAGGESIWTVNINAKAFVVPSCLELKFVYARGWELEPVKTQTVVIMTE